MDFSQKRLQVFVSSTYTDLIKERQSAVEAILTARHIPAGMELFTAGDESQMEVIKQWIDESDVYLLILGGRYGSMEPISGKSYTHLEFEYALEQGKPLFSCVLSESALDAKVASDGRSVLENENQHLLKAFRANVLGRLVKICDDHKDIKIGVAESLAAIARSPDLKGWVRASDEVNMAALADEIARLSKENANLRATAANSASEQTIRGLTYPQMLDLLKSQNALDVLIKTCGGSGDDSPVKIHRYLASMGLAEPYQFGGGLLTRYVATDAARVFYAIHQHAEMKAKMLEAPDGRA